MKKIILIFLLLPVFCLAQSKAEFWFSMLQPKYSSTSSPYVAYVSTFPELQAALSNSTIRQINIVTYDMLIEDTLNILRPVSIIGLGAGVTTLRMDTSTNVDVCFYIPAPVGNNITLSNFTIDGLQPLIDTATILSATVDIVTNVNMGSQFGIRILGGKDIRIENVNFKNIDGYGLYSFGAGGGSSAWEPSIFVDRVYSTNCYHAIAAINEYGQYTNIRSIRNVSGFTYTGGNNRITNGIFLDNMINAYVSGGANNSHGGFSNCSFNHASPSGHAIQRSIYGNGANITMSFTGNDIFQGDVELVDCYGWSFSGGTMACAIIITNGLKHQISGAVFFPYYGAGTFNVTGTGSLNLKNNFYYNGADASGINN